MQTILVAISSSSVADDLLAVVERIARATDATVVVFHLRERLFEGTEWFFGNGPFVEGRAESTQVLRHAVDRLRSHQVRARTATRGGRPTQVGPTIVAVAREEAADLIVVGFHPPATMFATDVVRGVLRSSSVPVLTVPVRDGTRRES